METWITTIYVLIIFVIGAVLMITRKLPALLALPIMGFVIAAGVCLIGILGLTPGDVQIEFNAHVLKGVLAEGSAMLAPAMLAAFFGGMLSFIMQKSGVAETLIKNGAELLGDNTLAVSFFSMLLVGLIFTTIGGLGAIIMVAIVILPMLATVGVPPVTAGGILLIGLSMGGVMNAQNWVLYINVLGLPQKEVRVFAIILFLLMISTGLLFVFVELLRARALTSLRQGIGALVVVGSISVLGITGVVLSHGDSRAPLPVFDRAFEELWLASDGIEGAPQVEFDDEGVVAVFEGSVLDEDYIVLEAEDASQFLGAEGMENLAETPMSEFQEFLFNVRSNFIGEVALTLDRTDAEPLELRQPVEPGEVLNFAVPVTDLEVDDLNAIERIRIAASVQEIPAATESQTPSLQFAQARFVLVERTSIFMRILQYAFGAFLVFLIGSILFDLLRRVRYWRRQVVSIKWYAMLIPILPLGLILIYSMDVNAALALGFTYAILATARPGTKSLAVQSMIQGASSVLPAVLLMVGIGILVRSIIGPGGFPEDSWPVTEAMRPLLRLILPASGIAFVIIFGLAAPLALYRGPLNLWGLGFGVAQLFLTAGIVPPAAIMAMLLSVGQIQGICDPTNTHNVWIANEVRVDVQALMLRTLPYVWGMAIVGLAIGAILYF